MIQAHDLTDLLSRLVDRSLVVYDQDSRRYCLLETVRQYSMEHALNLGDSVVAREAHADFFATMAVDANIKVRGPRQLEWLKTYDTEYDNIRLALEWWVSSPSRVEQALGLAFDMLDYWLVRGQYNEIAFWVGKFRDSGMVPDDANLARLLMLEESHRQFTGLPEAHLGERAIECALRSGDEALIAEAYTIQAFGRTQLKDEPAARAMAEKAFPILRKLGNTTMESFLLMNLGNLSLTRGHFDQAKGEYLRSLQIRREQGDLRGIGASIGGLAEVADLSHDLENAKKLWRFSIATFGEIGSRWDIAGCLTGLCLELCDAGEFHKAAQVLGCSVALQHQIGSVRDIADEVLYERHRKTVEANLSKEEFDRSFEEGRHIPWKRMLQIVYPEGLRLPNAAELDEICNL